MSNLSNLTTIPKDIQNEIIALLSNEEKMILAQTNILFRNAVISYLSEDVYSNYRRNMKKQIKLEDMKNVKVKDVNFIQDLLIKYCDDIDERQYIILEKFVFREITNNERKELTDDLEGIKNHLLIDGKKMYDEFIEDFSRVYAFRNLAVGNTRRYYLPENYRILLIDNISQKGREECLLKGMYIFDNSFRFQVKSKRYSRLTELINDDIARHLMAIIC